MMIKIYRMIQTLPRHEAIQSPDESQLRYRLMTSSPNLRSLDERQTALYRDVKSNSGCDDSCGSQELLQSYSGGRRLGQKMNNLVSQLS